MQRDSSTRAPGRKSPRAATGRSFLVIIIVASAVAIGITTWQLYSATQAGRARSSLAKLRI
jgi:hypothetical protein